MPARLGRFRLGILGLELVIELAKIRPYSGRETSGRDENLRELPRVVSALHGLFSTVDRLVACSCVRNHPDLRGAPTRSNAWFMARNLLRG